MMPGPSSMDVQASILVLHDPDAQAITVPNVAPAAATSPRKPPPKRVAARPVLMPNSTWNAMSALAGALLHLCPKRTCLSTTLYFKLSYEWSLSRGLGSRVMKSWQGTSVLQCAASCLSTESSSGRACMSGQCSNAGMLPGETLTWLAGGTARPQPVPAQSASAAAAAGPSCPYQEAGCRHQAHSSALGGPGAAGKRDSWRLSCQVSDGSLPGSPATSSQGLSVNTSTSDMLCNAELVQVLTQSLRLTVVTSPLQPLLCAHPVVGIVNSLF